MSTCSHRCWTCRRAFLSTCGGRTESNVGASVSRRYSFSSAALRPKTSTRPPAVRAAGSVRAASLCARVSSSLRSLSNHPTFHLPIFKPSRAFRKIKTIFQNMFISLDGLEHGLVKDECGRVSMMGGDLFTARLQALLEASCAAFPPRQLLWRLLDSPGPSCIHQP